MADDVFTLEKLVELSPDALNDYDIALLNLWSAHGLPGTEELDTSAILDTLDEWADKVQWEIWRHIYRLDPRTLTSRPLQLWKFAGAVFLLVLAASPSRRLRRGLPSRPQIQPGLLPTGRCLHSRDDCGGWERWNVCLNAGLVRGGGAADWFAALSGRKCAGICSFAGMIPRGQPSIGNGRV